MDKQSMVKFGIVVGIIAIVFGVAAAIYIPWQSKKMSNDSARDAREKSPENLEKLYDQWKDLMLDYRNGNQNAIYGADKLAVEIAELYGNDDILIPINGGHFLVDGSKL